MVGLYKLSSLVKMCNNEGYRDLARDFNYLRGRALGRAFCDYTYACEQIIDSVNGQYPDKFLNELRGILHA